MTRLLLVFVLAVPACGAAPSGDAASGENAGLPGAGGGGEPSDLVVQFGEYTNWRFRTCNEEF